MAELAPMVALHQRRRGPVFVARPRDGTPLPLSFAQERLWFLEQLDPGNAAYNLPLSLRLLGAVDVPALARAFDALMGRHETLRTTFAVNPGDTPVQRIHPRPLTALARIDLRGAPDPLAGARAEAGREARMPFDVSGGPLLRARLLEIDDEDQVLLLTMHHAISDRWSMDVLARELSALYEAFRRGGEPALPPLLVQYADYAVWQRGWLTER